MDDARNGQVITFYSFKGGTGRTMALANTAWILAAAGKRVLVADWDLESPGLHHFFHPFLPPEVVRNTPGVIDHIHAYARAAAAAARKTRYASEADESGDPFSFGQITGYAVTLEWSFPGGGTLDFLSSGLQNDDYCAPLSGADWEILYGRLGGGRMVDAMRAEMKNRYDYTLIDSPSGSSDVVDICTGHLPDTVANCFTLSNQGIEGAQRLVRKLGLGRVLNREIRILPVPMRVDDAEQAKADAGLAYARGVLAELPSDLDAQQRGDYWARIGIPYRPYYAFEETLTVFDEDSPGPLSLLGAYERLTECVTQGEVRTFLPLEPRVREQWRRRYEQRGIARITLAVLDYVPEDEIWAHWLVQLLTHAGISVVDPGQPEDSYSDALTPSSSATVVAVISEAYRAAQRNGRGLQGGNRTPWPSDRRGIYIADMRPLENISAAKSVRLTGLRAEAAIDQITALFGRQEPLPFRSARPLVERFPLNKPKVCKLPARNQRFAGRAGYLRELRELLHDPGAAPVGFVAIGGMAGVGKTQLALEYAHRYRSLYDVIWWIASGQPQFIEPALVDLGQRMTTESDVGVGVQSGIPGTEMARNVLQALRRESPTFRWLLIFDDAEEPAQLEPFLPSGAGHVIVTSRDNSWLDVSKHLQLDGFTREESISLLQTHANKAIVSLEEADRIASLLGDLPLAMAATGAWLAESRQSPQDLLRRLEVSGTKHATGDGSNGPTAAVAAAWDPSLDQLATKSGAAYRLLQVLSVLSPDGVSLDLVSSTTMADALTRLGPEPVHAGDVARLVQQIHRLALIKLDPEVRQLLMHRLLQQVVQHRTPREEVESIRRELQLLIALSAPEGDPDEPRTWPRYRMLWPHIESVGAASSDLERVRALLIDRVRYLWARDDQVGAQQAADATDAVWTAIIAASPDSPDTAVLRRQLLHLRFNKANALRADARLWAAYHLDTDVLAEQNRLLGPRHRHTLMTAGSLAADLRALGRYQDASELSRQTYDAWLDEFGPEYRRTLDAASSLAASLRLAGKYDGALELDESAYAWRTRVLTSTHPLTLSSANCIGLDMREAGRYEESAAHLREHFESARSAGESSSRAGLRLQVNLAASLRATGRCEEARTLLAEAQERYQGRFEIEDADALTCRLSMSNVLLSLADPEAADRILRSALDELRQSRSFGREHPLTLVASNNHVAVLRALQQLPEALQTAHTTLALLRQALGESHPFTLAAATNLAVCTAETGDLAAARALDRLTVEALTGLLGAGHPDTLRARANLALTCIELGESGAREEQQQIIADLGRLIGRNHPTVVALQSGRRAHRVLDGQLI